MTSWTKEAPLSLSGSLEPHYACFSFLPSHLSFQYFWSDLPWLQSPSKSFLSNLANDLPLTSTSPFPLWPADCRLPALPYTPVLWAVAEWGSGPHPRWTGGPGCGGPGTGAAAQVTTPHIPPLPTVCPIQQAAPSLLLAEFRVGASAPACTLRSQPVLNVGVTMRFTPSEVAKAVQQCWEKAPSALEAGNATVCFTIQKSSLDQLGESLPMGHSQPLTPRETLTPILRREWA